MRIRCTTIQTRGCCSSSDQKSWPARASAVTGSSETTVAVRGRDSIVATSPSNSPGPMNPSTTSRPSSVNVMALARPSIRISTRVGSSPSRSITAPRRNCRVMPRSCRARDSS